jgi:hypothetical protein
VDTSPRPATPTCAPNSSSRPGPTSTGPPSAWVYARRQRGAAPATIARSWATQQRLCARFRRLSAGKYSRNVVTVAVARELAGFLWAEMTTD